MPRSQPPPRPPRTGSRRGLLLVATVLASCGAGMILLPAFEAPPLGAPALADDGVRDRARALAHPTSGDATSAALGGALAAAAIRTLDAAQFDPSHFEREEPAPATPADPDAILRTDPPEQWLTSRKRRCRRQGRVGYCDGPLRVARPHGAAAERAEELGLGTFDTASHLLGKPPKPAWVEAVEGKARASLRWPVDGGNLWRGYGWVDRRSGKRRHLHKGVDIGADPGTPVVAVNDALVAYSHYQVRGYGNLVLLVHADGKVSLYAHLKAAYVFPGQRVRRGQVIGEVGHTGLARGPHLHFEWRSRAYPRDPVRFFVAVPEDQLERVPDHSLAHRRQGS